MHRALGENMHFGRDTSRPYTSTFEKHRKRVFLRIQKLKSIIVPKISCHLSSAYTHMTFQEGHDASYPYKEHHDLTSPRIKHLKMLNLFGEIE